MVWVTPVLVPNSDRCTGVDGNLCDSVTVDNTAPVLNNLVITPTVG